MNYNFLSSLNKTTAVLVIFVLLGLGACTSRTALPVASAEKLLPSTQQIEEPILSHGDVIAVGFLSANNLSNSPYIIRPGDILRIDVMDHPSLSRERIVVLRDGHISVPLVGRLKAAELGVDELGKTLTTEFESRDIIRPKVVVSVEQSEDALLPLLQLVNRNGQYEPLRYMIGHAKTIDLPFINEVSVNQPLSKLRQIVKQKYEERFGSQLYVMVKLIETPPPVVYVIGEVTSPGPVPYRHQNSPLMAIASAGGFMPTAESSDLRLFRRQQDNTYQNWSINLAGRLDQGDSTSDEIVLLPSDIIYVPRTGIADANLVVEQYIRNMLPVQFGLGFSYSINDGGNN